MSHRASVSHRAPCLTVPRVSPCPLVSQELDGNFTEENRRKCTEAAGPLLTAVDELTEFASSPQFASVPAKISQQVNRALSVNTPFCGDRGVIAAFG